MTTAAERLAALASGLDVGGVVPTELLPPTVVAGGVNGGAGHTHVWNEIPSGQITGSNAVFNLATAPNPPASLLLFRNGLLLRAAGNDYALQTAAITFVANNLPQPGDDLVASYTT